MGFHNFMARKFTALSFLPHVNQSVNGYISKVQSLLHKYLIIIMSGSVIRNLSNKDNWSHPPPLATPLGLSVIIAIKYHG